MAVVADEMPFHADHARRKFLFAESAFPNGGGLEVIEYGAANNAVFAFHFVHALDCNRAKAINQNKIRGISDIRKKTVLKVLDNKFLGSYNLSITGNRLTVVSGSRMDSRNGKTGSLKFVGQIKS